MDSKPTMEVFREMEFGESRRFQLDNSAEIYSAQAIAYRASNMLDCKFRCAADHVEKTLTITKDVSEK